MIYSVLLFLLTLLFPLLALRTQRIPGFPVWLSPVVQCFAVGIFVASFTSFPIDTDWATGIAAGSVLPALPLLLFSTRLEDSWRLTGRGLLSFLLCCISGMVATGLTAVWFADRLPDTDKIAGMLTGLYTGGTPNLQALSIALEGEELFIPVQLGDVVVGGIYLLLLASVLPRWLLYIFPPFTDPDRQEAVGSSPNDEPAESYRGWWRPLVGAVGVAALAVGVVWLFTGTIDHTIAIILLLTTLSIGASFLPEVRSWQKSYPLGEYLLLVFSVAVGCLANFRDLLAEGQDILLFSAIALTLTIFLHYFLAYLFRIDRDTLMISSVAALYGPPFVGQIVSVTNNKRLLAPGIALALFGFAIGNYLGVLVAYLVRWWIL